MIFGPSDEYALDSTKPYTVKAQFFADGYELEKIKVCLIQNGKEVATLEHTDATYLRPLATNLMYGMAVGISVFEVGTVNEIAGEC